VEAALGLWSWNIRLMRKDAYARSWTLMVDVRGRRS
jgi:hypothetical protein